MEKIYMEESKKQKKSSMNFSVVLSFVVAIFAVFSLGAFGIITNQGTGVSYAAVTGDSFTLKYGNQIISTANVGGVDYYYNFHTYNDGTNSIQHQIFCIERDLNVEENSTYNRTSANRATGPAIPTRGAEKTIEGYDISQDVGLRYLLSVGQSESQRKAINSNDIASAWVVQSAIWKYLAQKYPSVEAFKLLVYSDDYNELDDSKVINSDTVTIKESPSATGVVYNGLNTKVNELVTKANAATNPKIVVTKASDEVSKTEDGKYYQSALITVVGDPSDNFTSYDVTLTIPKTIGEASIVLEDGTVVEQAAGSEETAVYGPIAAGKKFYVRVPVEKVGEEVQNIKVSVSGKFEDLGIYYYKTGDDKLQRMASVVPGTVSGGTEVEFVGSPDTGMNAAQTIYFIGLIVLLCGVGIVYANAKPVEAKQ